MALGALHREGHGRGVGGGANGQQVHAGLAPRGVQAHARRRLAPARGRGGRPDAAHRPGPRLAPGVDEELDRVAGLRGDVGRAHAEVAHRDAPVPGQLGAVAGHRQAAAVQRRRQAAVAGLVAGLDRDEVRARGDRAPARREPVPVPDLGAVGELLLQDEPRRAGPGLEQAHDGLGPRRVQVHDGVAALLRGQQFGPELVARADGGDPRVRRRGVDPHRAREQHAAALVLERDAVAVAPVGRAAAVVGAPVPLQAHQGALGHVAPAEQLAHLVAVGVEDRDRDGVGLLDAEGQARHVEAPVAVGREDPAYADLPQDGRRVLQALGHEEGREGGEHEDGEDARRQSAQSVTSEALAISRAPAASSPRATTSARRMTPRWQTTSAGSAAGCARRSASPAWTRSDCSANDSPPG